MSQFTKLIFTLFLPVLIGACVQNSVKPQSSARVPHAQAQALLEQGLYLEAADEFLRLSQRETPPLQQEYQLRAADALVDARELVRARSIAESIATDNLIAAVETSKRIVLARLAAEDGDIAKVLELLQSRVAPTVPVFAKSFHLLRARAFEQTLRYLPAARERTMASGLLSVGDSASNDRAIWAALSRAPVAELRANEDSTEPFTAWLELSLITRRLISDPDLFGAALDDWTTRHPNHPANQGLVAELQAASLSSATPPEQIALLLPLDGKFARVAAAVRDGFLTAWYDEFGSGKRPSVTVWNTAGKDIWNVYTEAIAAGADFVVGPLDRPSVSTLAARGGLPVTTLALNQTDQSGTLITTTSQDAATSDVSLDGDSDDPGNSNSVLYQFSLSPEGDAKSVADHAWAQGFQSALLITPAGNWGHRVATAFEESWTTLGGQLADHRTFETDAPDMSEPVSALLGVDQSKERWKALRAYLGRDIKHAARRRKDVDFIFMAAFANQARLLRPQIKFQRGSDLPVYATSHVYSGVHNSIQDVDLDDVVFGDMPWILIEGGSTGRLKALAKGLWEKNFLRYTRLYAFGADAYRVISHLGRLRAQPLTEFEGETGWLSVDENSQIHRRLTWARFVEGIPILAEPADTLE